MRFASALSLSIYRNYMCIFEIVASYFYLKAYLHTSSLVEYGGNSENVIFEIVALFFYPKPYTSYGELGRKRGKYPKIIS